MIPPGSTIGILGGGQLGRMLALAAANLGYRVHVYAPEEELPAADVAAEVTRAAYMDLAALDRFAAAIDVATYEFENVDLACVEHLAQKVSVRPGARSLKVSQDRLAEKRFVEKLGGSPAPFRAVDTLDSLADALGDLGFPAILKTRRFGYDGKGQVRIDDFKDVAASWRMLGGKPAVLEGLVRFEAEFSILLARGDDGQVVVYDAPCNNHEGGILMRSEVPAGPRIEEEEASAAALARAAADQLGHIGLLTFEFFSTPSGAVFNEMAPRVHNSGHWTIEGARTSQFENHIRAVCGLPLGDTRRTAPAVSMDNLLGDAAHDWAALLADSAAHLHLYGKSDPRPGRKMGHVTRLSS